MDHLKYAGATPEEQRSTFLDILWNDPLVRDVLRRARDFDVPAGCA